jgi:hypothetical protein
MSQIKLAEAQLLGYAHGTKGFSIKQLTDAMGLTKREWLKLRDETTLKPTDKQDLDDLYGVK